jgi:purine catabolism regulator
VTVALCLELPVLAKARIVAGRSGLGRRVRWVQSIDRPDLEESLTGGELLLGTGVILGHDKSLQRRLMPLLQRRGSAAIGIALGPYMQELPPSLVNQAERLGLPLLVVPWETDFRDVGEAVTRRILEERYAFLEKSDQVHRELTDIVLGGGDGAALCQRLAGALGRRVLLLDTALKPIAAAPETGQPLVSRNGATTAALQRELVRHFDPALPRRSGTSLAALAIARRDDQECLIAPVMVGERRHGYLVVEGGGSELAEIDVATAERAAIVAALLSYKDEQIREVERRRQADVLRLLLEERQLEPAVAERAQRLGLAADGRHAVLVCTAAGPGELAESAVERALSHAGISGQVLRQGRHVAAIVRLRGNETPATAAERLLRAFTAAAEPAVIAFSDVVVGLPGLGLAHEIAREALRVGRAVDSDRLIHGAPTLDAVLVFAAGLRAAGGEAPGEAQLDVLAAQHRRQDGRLFETLDCFLRHESNTSRAARVLGIHRHSLIYRIERITEILGTDLTPAVCLNLRLALLARRLREQARAGG